MNAPSKLDDIRKALVPLAKLDFESILSKVSLGQCMANQIGQVGRTQFEPRVTFLLQLRTLLNAVEQLGEATLSGNSKILGALQKVSLHAGVVLNQAFTDERIVELSESIRRHLKDDAALRKSSKNQAARQVKLFAVREEILPLLDVARQTFRENDADIQQCKLHYPISLMIVVGEFDAEVGLVWTETGYRFVADASVRLPPDCINVETSKR